LAKEIKGLVDTGFCGWATDHADSFAWTFASAGVGLGSLSTDRQTAQVPDAAIAFDTLQPFEIHADFPAEVTFNDILSVLDGMDNLRELLLG
jgi:hypothetical protein